MTIDLLPLVLGAAVGVILALTGAGGGILAVPLLVFGLGLTMAKAAPVGLLAVGLAAGVGAVLGLRQGIVRYRAAGLIAAVGIATAPAGQWLAHRVPNEPLAIVFGGLLIYVAVRMFRQASSELREAPEPERRIRPCVVNPEESRLRWTLPCARALALTGVVSGLLSGLLGVGGGFVIVPALKRNTDLDTRNIVATSLAIIALVSLGSVGAATVAGHMDWMAGAPFAAGAVLGLMGGRLVADRIKGPRLQQAFAVVAVIAALLLFARALGLASPA